MDPIRRPPWEVSSGNDFPVIDPQDQYRRDLIRLQMLERERGDAEAMGRPDLAAAAQREITATQKQMGGTTAALPAEQGPLRAPPWEQKQPAPSRGSYDFPLPSEMVGRQSSDGFFRRSLDIPTKLAAGIPSALSSATGLVGAVAPWARGATDPLAELFAESGRAINKNFLSDYQQQKEQELAKRLAANPGFFEGAGEGFKFLGENPLYAVPSIAESIPSMIGGGYLGRGLQVGTRGLGYRMPASTAGALGEGGMIAGSVGTDIASKDPNASRIPAIVAGAGGAVVGRYGARLMGGADVESAIASRLARGEATDMLSPAGTTGGRFVRGVVGEGLLEEAPQSVMERMATNYSSGRPIMEGAGGEAVIGAASGAMMGGGFGLRRPSSTYTPDELKASLKVMADPRSAPEDAVSAADFVRRVETGTLGEAEANKRFNDYLNDVFGSKVEPGGEAVDLLKGANKSSQEILAELRRSANDPNEPSVWRFPVSTGLQGDQRGQFTAGPEAFQQTPGQTWRSSLRGGPQVWRYPVATGLEDQRRAQFAAGPEGMTAAPTTTTPPLSPTQQFAAAGPQAQTSATLPVQQVAATTPSGGISTTVPPSAPAAPGAFSTAATAQPAAKPTKAKKAVKVVAPKKTVIARSIEQAMEEELNLADTESDVARVNAIMSEVNKEKLGAEVQGAKQIKAPGRVSLSQRSLLGIRDAIFRKSGKVAKAFGRKEQKVVDAVSEFSNAYDAYLNYSANIAREVKKGIQAKADERIAKIEELAKDVQNALYRLGQSVDNNAKNVEAVVRVVKDAAQRKLANPGKTKEETLASIKSLDTALSSGWAAAKRESFMKELPDLADVSGQVIRPSTEMKEKGATASAVESAAKNGYVNPQGRGEKYTGLAGALQYLRFNTTPMGRILARTLRDALVESNNPAKISFVDKSGSRYDPKTNTVYINRSEQSAEVILHETFHAALQWYVYQNPNSPAVKQLQLSLERALSAKGLEGKALEVQNILQDLVNKKRGLDAVLELVSYNATLNEFRRAMQEIKTGDAPKSFLDSIRSVWAMYKAIVRRMLGVGDTVASDIMSASMQLLEESTKAQMPKSLTGKALDIATTAFKRWFGDSKVVDSDGQPLVVYHGTANSFAEFSSKLLGGATGAPSAKLGFFFAGSPITAAKYARNAEKSNRRTKTETEIRLDIEKEGIEFHVKRIAEEKARQTDEAYRNFRDKMKENYGVDDSETARQSYDEMIQRHIDYHEESISEKQAKVKELENLVEEEKGIAAKGEKTGANIIPVFLSIKNPMVIDQKKSPYRIMSYYETLRKAKAAGHDGVIIKNTFDGMPQPGWITSLIAKVRKLETPSDTIYIAFDSNQIKSIFNQEPTEAPGILEAKVQSGKPLQAAVQSNKATQTAAGITAQDYRKYRKDISPVSSLSKMFFDIIGWEQGAKKFSEGASNVADMIRKDFPTLERYLIYINSRFSAGTMTSQEIENYKVNKSVGYQQMERLANFVTNRSADEIRALFDYMDGNKKALDGLADKNIMSRTADNVMEWFKTYVADLPAAERSFFETRKFSESLLYASKSAQVASSTFGARKLSSVLGLKHKSENTLEGFMDWLAKDENGDVDLNSRFYEVFKSDGLRPGDGPEHAGYMSISEFEKRGRKAPDGFQVDATREWWMSQYDPDRGYKFSSSMTAKQAIQENKVDELSNAMRNTMAALANNYASRQFSKALAADKSIAFDSLEDIKDFTGQVIDENQVLNISQEESKSPQISSLYRRSGTWVKLPDSAAYGDLANKYIPGPVWSAMVDMADKRPLVEFGLYNDTMRWFKKSKTVYNPGTHVTNVASNITLAMMHDIPMSTLGNAARIFALYEVNPKALTDTELDMMSSFMNSGAMLGNFSSAEVKKALYDAWKDNMAAANDNSLMKRLAAFTNYEKSKAQKAVQLATKIGKKADYYASELYAAEDNIFRLAAFLTKAGDLQTRDKTSTATPEQLREAGDFARKAFLDYDIDSKAVRVLRQSLIPFISWGYAVAPVLGRIALHQPWKIANILMAYYLLDVALASMAGGDDDELRKKGPEYMRERMFFGSFGPNMYVRIPFMGDQENPVYYKLGDYVPFASITKGLPNGLFGQSWIPSMITPSGPFVSATAGLLLGVDPYTGKDIHKPTDSEWDKLVNSATFAYDTAMPSAVSSKNINKVKDIVDEKVGVTGVAPSNLVMARMLGFKLYDYNIDESAAIQDKVVKGIEKDFKAAMTKAKKEEYRKGYPDYEALDKEIDTLRERMEKRIAEVRGNEEQE